MAESSLPPDVSPSTCREEALPKLVVGEPSEILVSLAATMVLVSAARASEASKPRRRKAINAARATMLGPVRPLVEACTRTLE